MKKGLGFLSFFLNFGEEMIKERKENIEHRLKRELTHEEKESLGLLSVSEIINQELLKGGE